MFPKQLIEALIALHEDVLGPEDFDPELMTHDKKTYFSPTCFETLGQNSIKSSRCYSITMTHQHPRGLVGPTAGGKVYDEEEEKNKRFAENVQLRQRTIEV